MFPSFCHRRRRVMVRGKSRIGSGSRPGGAWEAGVCARGFGAAAMRGAGGAEGRWRKR